MYELNLTNSGKIMEGNVGLQLQFCYPIYKKVFIGRKFGKYPFRIEIGFNLLFCASIYLSKTVGLR